MQKRNTSNQQMAHTNVGPWVEAFANSSVIVKLVMGFSSPTVSNLRPPAHTQWQPFRPVQNHLQPARSSSTLEISTSFSSVTAAPDSLRAASDASSVPFNLRPPAHTQRQPFRPVQNHLQPARSSSTLEISTSFSPC